MAEIGIATNKKLIQVFNMMTSGELITAPDFQRKLVWNDAHKESFIETILTGYPFPEVYFADGEIDLKTMKTTTLVVDGQQRLSTIFEYITGKKFDGENFVLKSIPAYEKLSEEEQTSFLDYKIVIRDLGRLENAKIKEIFSRINSVNYALNAIEIQNALYEGAFIQCAKDIISSSEFIKELSIFSDSESSRMKDVEYILLIMTTVEEGGYFAFNSEVPNYIKKYDGEYPGSEEMKKTILKAFDFLTKVNIEPDSTWSRRSSFFTLILEILRRINLDKPDITPEKMKEFLSQFELNLLQNKSKKPEESPYAEYYYYIYQSTGSKKGRVVRARVFTEALLKFIAMQHQQKAD